MFKRNYNLLGGNHLTQQLSILNIERGTLLPCYIGLDTCVDFSKIRFLQISGNQGSGKTNVSRQLLASLLFLNDPSYLRIWALDNKGNFGHFRKCINFFDQKEQIVSVAKYLPLLAKRKQDYLTKKKLDDINTFNARYPLEQSFRMPYDIIFLEELGSTFSGEDEALESLTNVSEVGRSCGVYLVQIAQSPRASVVGGSKGGVRGKAQFEHKLAFKQTDQTNALIAGSEATTSLQNLQAIYIGADDGVERKISYHYYKPTEIKENMFFFSLLKKDFGDKIIRQTFK